MERLEAVLRCFLAVCLQVVVKRYIDRNSESGRERERERERERKSERERN